jgi:putative transposase
MEGKLSNDEGRQYLFFHCGYVSTASVFFLEKSRSVLREVIGMVRGVHPFSIEAWVLLPDHMHCMWRLLEGDTDYSLRWALIKKRYYSRKCTAKYKNALSRSR